MTNNAVITGANRGIGLSLTQHYQAQGKHVYAICRQSSAALKASGATVIDDIDVSKPEDIKALSQELNGKEFSLLINNAGILRDEVLGHINYDTIQQQFDVNTLGPLRITEALHNQLVSGAKVAMITSRMGSVTDNTSGGRYGYRMSKAALNIASVSLSHDLKNSGISFAIIHPGLVGTDMIGGYGDLTSDQAATQIAQRIDELTLENTGSFWHANGSALPW